MASPLSLQAVAWLSALLQGVAAFFLQGLILCVEPGGHTAVEWFASSDCCLKNVAVTSLSRDDCSDCTDASLLQPIVEKRYANAIVFTAAAVWAVATTSAPADGDWSTRATARAPAPPDDLSARRTVVLQA